MKTLNSIAVVRGRSGYVPLRDGLKVAEAARAAVKIAGAIPPARVLITWGAERPSVEVAVYSNGSTKIVNREP